MQTPEFNDQEIHQQSADGADAKLLPYDIKASVDAFNRMYKLPVGDRPGFWYVKETPGGLTPQEQVLKRLFAFRKTLFDELNEGAQIAAATTKNAEPVDVLTDMADWLGDICIYCISEMRKHGLDPNMVFSIIMASNMSKLGADGVPIYDEHNKVLKGPNYWKPEPMLKAYIQLEWRRAALRDATAAMQVGIKAMEAQSDSPNL